MIAEGAISVKAALLNGKRDVHEIYLRRGKDSRDVRFIMKKAAEKGIPVRILEEGDLFSVLSGKSHGGIGAEVSERRNDDLKEGDILYLDGIEDPFNLGYILRSACALGVENILLGKRDYSTMEMQILKSSAGAYDQLNIRIMDDEVTELKKRKKAGYTLYGLYRGDDSKDIFDTAFKENALFILGGEKRGIKKEVLDLCDETLFISYGSRFRNALNAAAAADVVLTLRYSQRRGK